MNIEPYAVPVTGNTYLNVIDDLEGTYILVLFKEDAKGNSVPAYWYDPDRGVWQVDGVTIKGPACRTLKEVLDHLG